MLVTATTLAYLLVVWFNTQAISEYGRLWWRLSRWLKLDEYADYQEFSGLAKQPSYADFLVSAYPSFFTRLLSCPVCLSLWLAVPLTALFQLPLVHCFATAFTGLMLYQVYLRLVLNDQRDAS